MSAAAQVVWRSSFRRDRGDAGGSLTQQVLVAEPGHAPLLGVPTGACSRAEAEGGGAPTGMSATAAVAGRPIHTLLSLRGRRSKGVLGPGRRCYVSVTGVPGTSRSGTPKTRGTVPFHSAFSPAP